MPYISAMGSLALGARAGAAEFGFGQPSRVEAGACYFIGEAVLGVGRAWKGAVRVQWPYRIGRSSGTARNFDKSCGFIRRRKHCPSPRKQPGPGWLFDTLIDSEREG